MPGLNAIVSHCANVGMKRVLMISAEIRIDKYGIESLYSHFDDDTLVVGAALPGHDHHRSLLAGGTEEEGCEVVEVELTGRTAPWNTCAIWDVNKLALTGFLLVSEGLHRAEEGGGCEDGTSTTNTTAGAGAGVEEVATIAVIQRMLGSHQRAKAKLVMLKSDMINWDEDFDNDDGRREWHERKMRSKLSRAKRQLDLLNLDGSGIVMHC